MRTIGLQSAQQWKHNRHCWAYATRTHRQWIRQAARRARPHQAVFSTTQSLSKQSHVYPKPFLRRQSRRYCLFLQASAVIHYQECVEILSRRFLPQGQEPHGRVVTFHSRQNFGCRRRTTHALDCSRFPKRSKRPPSVQSCSSNKRFDHLVLPVVQIAERTVMKHRQALDTSSILEDDSVLLGVLGSRVCSLRVQDGRCHKLTRQRRSFPRQVRAELGRPIVNGPDDRAIIGH
jgi:hypothetical protein